MVDEDYRKLQSKLISNPEIGKIIKGSGGIRKIRWSIEGRGKSGGVRIIYYWFKEKETLLMLTIYKKSESDDLTNQQIRILKTIVEEELQ